MSASVPCPLGYDWAGGHKTVFTTSDPQKWKRATVSGFTGDGASSAQCSSTLNLTDCDSRWKRRKKTFRNFYKPNTSRSESALFYRFYRIHRPIPVELSCAWVSLPFMQRILLVQSPLNKPRFSSAFTEHRRPLCCVREELGLHRKSLRTP